MSATQHSNVCHRTAMADTQLILWRERVGSRASPAAEGASCVRVVSIHLVCASCVYPPSLLSAITRNHVLWRLSNSETLHRVKKSTRLHTFFGFSCFLVRTQPAVFYEKAKVCSFTLTFAFVFFFLARTVVPRDFPPVPVDLPGKPR